MKRRLLPAIFLCWILRTTILAYSGVFESSIAALAFAAADGFGLGVVLLLAEIRTRVKNRLVRSLLLASGVGFCLTIFVDTVLLGTFGVRMRIALIERFIGDWAFYVESYATLAVVSVLLIWLVGTTSLTRPRPTKDLVPGWTGAFVGAMIMVVTAICGYFASSDAVVRHALTWNQFVPTSLSSYFDDSALAGERYTKAKVAAAAVASSGIPILRLPPGDPDVILVIIESMSAVDSLKTSGLSDLFVGFDKLAERGRLFRKFFANGFTTEPGVVTLLTGNPPVPFPGSGANMYRSYADRPSIAQAFRARGYQTIFRTATDLHFLDRRHFIRKMEFDDSGGSETVELFKAAPKAIFNGVPDTVLYGEALRLLRGHNTPGRKPIFLTLETNSSHKPYNHPVTAEQSHDAVWRYVDSSLVNFITALEQSLFFRNGIVIITGDHRKLDPVTAVETQRYGASADARIPLLILGAGVQPGIDDRFFQQSDLFRNLDKAMKPDRAPISDPVVYVDYYGYWSSSVKGMEQLRIYSPANDAQKAYELAIQGTTLAWKLESPPGGSALVSSLHHLRALDQWQFEDSGLTTCAVLSRAAKADGDALRPEIILISRRGKQIRTIPLPPELLQATPGDLLAVFQKLSLKLRPRESVIFRLPVVIDKESDYEWSTPGHAPYCIRIDGQIVIDGSHAKRAGTIGTTYGGKHLFPGRYEVMLGMRAEPLSGISLSWKTTEELQYRPFAPGG